MPQIDENPLTNQPPTSTEEARSNMEVFTAAFKAGGEVLKKWIDKNIYSEENIAGAKTAYCLSKDEEPTEGQLAMHYWMLRGRTSQREALTVVRMLLPPSRSSRVYYPPKQ